MELEFKESFQTGASIRRHNQIEAYISSTRNKISESGELGAFISNKERDELNSAFTKADNWLHYMPLLVLNIGPRPHGAQKKERHGGQKKTTKRKPFSRTVGLQWSPIILGGPYWSSMVSNGL